MRLENSEILSDKQMLAIGLLIEKAYNNMTDQEIADKVGVSRSTLFNWRKQPAFNDELIKQSREVNRATLSTAFSYVNRTLENPQVKDTVKVKLVELILKQNGEMKETVDVNANVNSSETVDQLLQKHGITVPTAE